MTAPPHARRALRGDLDAIVLKAMSREVEHRYASARELADDIQRHLDGQPVLARGPHVGYQVRRLIRRHRAAAAAAALSVGALAVALTISIGQARRAETQRTIAEQRFADVRRLANALMFDIHDAVAPLQGSTPVRERIVANALIYLERLHAEGGDDPALRLELARGYSKIAAVQGLPSAANLGNRQGAIDNFRKAAALFAELSSRPGAPASFERELARVQLQLAETVSASGDQALARQISEEAAGSATRAVARAPDDDQALRVLGSVYFQQAVQAPLLEGVSAWQRAGEIFDRLLAERPEDPDRQRNVALVSKYLGSTYVELGQYTPAIAHYRRAHDLDRRRLEAQPDNRQAQFDIAIDLSNLAQVSTLTGNWPEAVRLYEESLRLRREFSDRDPADVFARSRVAFSLSRLGNAYSHVGRHSEALAHGREALAVQSTLGSAGTYERAEFLKLFGGTLSRAGRPVEACGAWRESSALLDTVAAASDGTPGLRLDRSRQDLAVYLARCSYAPR
jgi:non-specific serine/threonine protein kinase/serine/threonine-protein kinase